MLFSMQIKQSVCQLDEKMKWTEKKMLEKSLMKDFLLDILIVLYFFHIFTKKLRRMFSLNFHLATHVITIFTYDIYVI